MSRTGASCLTGLGFPVIAISLLDLIPEDVDTVAVSPAEMIVTARTVSGGGGFPAVPVRRMSFWSCWRARAGNRIAREWSLWREGEPRREDDRLHGVLFQWEHADPPPGLYLTAGELEARFEARWAETQRQREARAAGYDRDRAMARLKLLSAQADAGFMRHVLANPASDAQRGKATEFLAIAEREIKALEVQVGDPDAIPDEHGDLPAARRGYNLDSHMRLFRREALRAWSKGQRPRFRELLTIPVLQPADMCPECQAPADWHTYGVSLRLFQPKPESGSQAQTIARLMPGWWERCPASTIIQIRQQWGQGLPDFDGAAWQAMLTRCSARSSRPRRPGSARNRTSGQSSSGGSAAQRPKPGESGASSPGSAPVPTKEGASEPDQCPPDGRGTSVRPLRLLLLERQEARIPSSLLGEQRDEHGYRALRRGLLSFRADARAQRLPVLRKLPRFPPDHAGQRTRSQGVLPPAWRLAGEGEEPPPPRQPHHYARRQP